MSIRLRYTLVFAILIFGFAIVAYKQIRDDLETRYREAVEENLVDQAQMLASLLQDSNSLEQLKPAMQELQQRKFLATIYRYQKTQSKILVYVTDYKGQVLYHSADSTQIGVDYSTWRDVYLTLKGRYGARSTRIDPKDDNSSILYVAAPILQHNQITGVVTVGKPVQDFHSFLQGARNRLMWWLALGSGILVLMGLLAGIWVMRPMQRLSNDLAAKRYVEDYVQVLTHELKSPISAILGATEILESKPGTEVEARFLGNIRSEIQRLRDLVSAILQVAALERKKNIEHVKSISWKAMITQLQESVQVHCHAKNIRIQWPDFDMPWNGDPLLIFQALHNLLINAIEYAPIDSTIEMNLQLKNGRILGSIRDHGPGIPDYALPRLFEKFYSLPKPGSGKKGTGLGLAFALQCMRLHQGQVRLSNAEGGGALAEFELPIRS